MSWQQTATRSNKVGPNPATKSGQNPATNTKIATKQIFRQQSQKKRNISGNKGGLNVKVQYWVCKGQGIISKHLFKKNGFDLNIFSSLRSVITRAFLTQ